MRTPDDTILEAIAEALDYDPDTGRMVWMRETRRASVGTPAGSLRHDDTGGHLVIGFGGKQYQAGHIAWFLAHRQWPPTQVLFKDGDPLNLRKTNLKLRAFMYRDTPKARQMRRYRDRLKERGQTPAKPAPRPKSELSTVSLSADGTLWSARACYNPLRVLATFDNQVDAENYARWSEIGWHFVAANLAPPYQAAPEPKAGTGKGVITLADALDTFAYDPGAGMIFYRWPEIRRGCPAVQLNDRNRPFIRYSGRQYPAGMMAWFMTHGVWPQRKQIAYRDDDPRNIKLKNLYLKGAAE